jgi:hypothetical protein
MRNGKSKKLDLQLYHKLIRYILKNHLNPRLGRTVNSFSLGWCLLCLLRNLIGGACDLPRQSQQVGKALVIDFAKSCSSCFPPIQHHIIQDRRATYASS